MALAERALPHHHHHNLPHHRASSSSSRRSLPHGSSHTGSESERGSSSGGGGSFSSQRTGSGATHQFSSSSGLGLVGDLSGLAGEKGEAKEEEGTIGGKGPWSHLNEEEDEQ